MTNKRSEISDELRSVISGKTLDAVFPPLVYALVNSFFSLETAAISAVSVVVLIGIVRIAFKQTFKYAFGGLVAVLIAAAFAYMAGQAANFFLPRIIGSAFLLILTLGSLLAGKPVAALASHLSRGWNLKWYWRPDIKPAYTEVTCLWLLFLLMRLLIQITLFLQADILRLTLVNILLGMPFTIAVLVLSYVYGIWRLKKLGGPGIEEYKQGKEAPWKGQTRGF